MAKTTTVNMRVDGELKRQAEKICEDIGLTPSAAYTLFLKAIVRTRSIPFKLEVSNLDANYLIDSLKNLENIDDNEYFK